MSQAARDQLCKRLAKPLGVSAEALRNVGQKKVTPGAGFSSPPPAVSGTRGGRSRRGKTAQSDLQLHPGLGGNG